MKRELLLLGPLPPPPGGVSIHVAREKNLLEQAGISYRIRGLGGWFPEGVDLPGFLNALWGTSVAMCLSLLGGQSAVHLHHSRWFYTLPVLAMIRLRGTPMAVTVHSDSLAEDLGHMPRFLASLMVRLLSGASLLVPVSDRVRDSLAEAGVRSKCIEVIPAFLPPSPAEIDPAVLGGDSAELHGELSRDGGKLLVASAYNLGPGYGLEDVYGLELLAEALSDWDPEDRITLVVGVSRNVSGPGQERSERRLKELLSGSEIRLELLFGEPLLPFLSIADGYVRPSRVDGDSVAVREAMALGIPVAASDATRRPEGVAVFSLESSSVRSVLTALMSTGQRRAETVGGTDEALLRALIELLPGRVSTGGDPDQGISG